MRNHRFVKILQFDLHFSLHHFIFELQNQIPLMSKYINALFLLLILSSGCQKKEASVNPCEGLMNETAPVNIIIQFLEQSTDKNLILTKDVQSSDVSVTDVATGKPVLNWRLMKTESSNSPINGSLQFSIFASSAAQHSYHIDIKQVGSATLSFSITKKDTGDACQGKRIKIVAYLSKI